MAEYSDENMSGEIDTANDSESITIADVYWDGTQALEYGMIVSVGGEKAYYNGVSREIENGYEIIVDGQPVQAAKDALSVYTETS